MSEPLRRQRRALSHVGGTTEASGDPALSRLLAKAFEVESSLDDESAARAHVHGFHSYPARMHPAIAASLIRDLSKRGDVVLDPFCGSGTVLVEARLASRRAYGVDANPLAVMLCRRKLEPSDPAQRAEILSAAMRVAEVAEERRKKRAGASRRYGRDDVESFDPHILLELDGLRVGLADVKEPAIAQTLALVLSSILVKLSRRASDTSAQDLPRRLAAGYPSRLFVRRAEELCTALAEVAAPLSVGPASKVVVGDARTLPGVGSGSVELCVTSPPYPGVYDYLDHHALRLRWLGLDAGAFARSEIGARRGYDRLGPRVGLSHYRAELGPVLTALRRVLAPNGRAVLVVADSVVGGAPAYCDEIFPELAAAAHLDVLATVAQPRPYFHAPTAKAFRRKPRREYLIALGRSVGDGTHPDRLARDGADRDRAPSDDAHRAATPRGSGGRGGVSRDGVAREGERGRMRPNPTRSGRKR